MKTKNFVMSSIFLLLLVFSVSALPTSENAETSCTSTDCTTALFSYPKYLFINNQWILNDESFTQEGCNQGYSYCSHDYGKIPQLNVESSYNGLTIEDKGKALAYKISSFNGFPLQAVTPLISGNKITYPNIIPSLSADYEIYSVWYGVKEQLRIKNRETFATLPDSIPFTTTLTTSDYSMQQQGDGSLLISDGSSGKMILSDITITDEHDNVLDTISFTPTTTDSTTTLIAYLNKNKLLQYPWQELIIDPSFSLNVSTQYDLHIIQETVPGQSIGYTLSSSGTRLNVGYSRINSTEPKDIGRIDLGWNVATIPDNAAISDLSLTLYASSLGSTSNQNISAVNMDKNWTQHTFDANYWADMGDGKIYTTTNYLSAGYHIFNLVNASQDLQKNLTRDFWNVGLFSPPGESIQGNGVSNRIYASSENADASKRPFLNVTYTFAANETDGDQAIEQGILASLPLAIIRNEQQAYTRNSANLQQIGRFDKVASFNNQRWAFNYITAGQSFTNMQNLSTTFFVFEFTALDAEDIQTKVSSYIDATKNP